MEDRGPDGGGRHPGVHDLLPELGPLDELHLQGHRLQQTRHILPSQIGRRSKFFLHLFDWSQYYKTYKYFSVLE